jgi:Tfp pilus assembly protein PilZ
MNQTLEGLTLPELVSRLRDVHTMRTPMGWPTDSAVTKSSIEHAIVDLVARRPPSEGHDDPAERIPCDHEVKLRAANRASVKSSQVDLRVGGVFVATDAAFTVGEPVELELELDSVYRLKSGGTVGWSAQASASTVAGIGISFNSVVGDAAERRLEKLVLELLKYRVDR